MLPGPLLPTHGEVGGTGDDVYEGGGSTDILLLGPGDDLGLGDDIKEEEKDFCFLVTGPALPA